MFVSRGMLCVAKLLERADEIFGIESEINGISLVERFEICFCFFQRRTQQKTFSLGDRGIVFEFFFCVILWHPKKINLVFC